ncbi:MAG: cation:proton antiporter [Ruminococcus sp.]|nr:cation:proton antiporter [Ruminococcus sp.]
MDLSALQSYINKVELFRILLPLALVFCLAKFLGLVARKLSMPQVVGQILAGILLGPCVFNLVDISDPSYGLSIRSIAEIGVIMLMFSAGLGTDLKELLRVGPTAFFVALAGVFVPLAAGTGIYWLFGFDNGNRFFEALLIGTVLSATSVSITVQALKELGYLRSKVGNTILSAAIIDDIIGIIVLTFVITLSDSEGKGNHESVWIICLKVALFFAIAIGLGFLLYHGFKWLEKRRPHTRTIPIFAMAFCFFFSYAAETFFGIAEITGAYAAGIMFCQLKSASYIEEKIDVCLYMFFGPVFFASVGLKSNLKGMHPSIIVFALVLTFVAMAAKVVGCGLAAKLCGYRKSDSLKVGVGMMTRGEVALIVTDKGITSGIIGRNMNFAVIPLVIISSLATPVLLKVLYAIRPDNKVKKKSDRESQQKAMTYGEMYEDNNPKAKEDLVIIKTKVK